MLYFVLFSYLYVLQEECSSGWYCSRLFVLIQILTMVTISIRAVANCHCRLENDKYQRVKENIKCEIETSCFNICF